MPRTRNLGNYRSRYPEKPTDFGISSVNFGSSGMGLRQSKEELLYNHAINGQIEEIITLHRDGASLEDLMQGRLYIMPRRRDLNGLLNYFFLRETPLDVARVKGHTNVVRTIESHICFFSGWLRELYGPGFLDVLAPQLLSRKIWVVVVPAGSRNPRKPLKLQLAMYTSLQDARPRTTITLWKAKVEEPKFSQPVPVMNIYDKATRTRYKLASSDEGAKQQLQWLCNACRGIPQVQPNSHAPPPPTTPPSNAMVESTMEETPRPPDSHPSINDNNTNGWGSSVDNTTHNGWLTTEVPAPSEASSSGWVDEPPPVDAYNGWGTPQTEISNSPSEEPPETASSHNGWGPVEGSNSPSRESSIGWSDEASEAPPSITHMVPSAPPVPEGADYGPIHYPSIDFSPVEMSMANIDNQETKDGVASSCVICLDAPVEGACIPCGHMAGCMSCLNEIQGKKWGCPVCRSKIDQVIRLYAV